MKQIKTKEDVFRAICNASLLGTLGLFVGSGFTKAVLENNFRYSAYTWPELLNKCCDKMEVNKDVLKNQNSYPEIATKICKQYCINNEEIKYIEAVHELKSTICELTNVYPEQEIRENYANYFKQIPMSWITTTNYDTVLESILGGGCLSIAPDSCFSKIRNMIPIYHIHGICNIPSSIVITNEDYAYMFRPYDYRQSRLPFLMKESLVLMIGYALGDLNVITAVDWANNVYTNTSDEFDFPIIQLLYTNAPKGYPYTEENGVVIFEVADLNGFFGELYNFSISYNTEYNKYISLVNEYIAYFNNYLNEVEIDNFIHNKEDAQDRTIKFISELPQEFGYVYISFFTFIHTVMTKLDELSKPQGAFNAYDWKLEVILNILKNVPLKKMPSSFFGMIASSLDDVAAFIGPEIGNSYAATARWNSEKKNLPSDVVDALWRFVKSGNYLYYNLKDLLKKDKNLMLHTVYEKLTELLKSAMMENILDEKEHIKECCRR